MRKFRKLWILKECIVSFLSGAWQVLLRFQEDNGFFLSSGIAFNVLVNVIPLTLLFLSLIGTYLYNYQAVLNHMRAYLRDVAPSLDPNFVNNLFGVIENRKIVGILGIAGLIWVSTWVFGSLRIALNIVFRVDKSQGLVRGMGVDILMILVVGVFLLVSMILTSAITFIQNQQHLLPIFVGPTLQWVLKYLVPFFFSYWMFFLVYTIIPNRRIHSGPAFKAAAIASLLWEVAKQLFGLYVTHLTSLPLIYGSLSTLVIFIFWVYYSAAVLIIGGECAHIMDKRLENQKGGGEGHKK